MHDKIDECLVVLKQELSDPKAMGNNPEKVINAALTLLGIFLHSIAQIADNQNNEALKATLPSAEDL